MNKDFQYVSMYCRWKVWSGHWRLYYGYVC